LVSSSGEALAAKPAGSKKPTGGRSPINPVGFSETRDLDPARILLVPPPTFLVAERDVDERSTEAGANAAALARTVDRMASFMVGILVGCKGVSLRVERLLSLMCVVIEVWIFRYLLITQWR